MNKKVTWLLVSCLMVLALMLASCGSAVIEEQEEEVVTEQEEEVITGEEEEAERGPEMVQDSLGRLVEKPKYGGQFIQISPTGPRHFDEPFGHPYYSISLFLTQDELYQSDYAKGLAGTGEVAYQLSILAPPEARAPRLATSWELVDDTTVVFQIRQGVRWHNKPPTNGREMTADDVVFSLKRMWEIPTSIQSLAYPWDTYVESITTPDKWTVVVKSKPGRLGSIYPLVSDLTHIVPRDAVEMYGDLEDWRNSIGTGPFMLVDYVTESSVTYVRNPNYWMKDPLHLENTLPYVDGVLTLVILDASTIMAAMRTGKIDMMGSGWENAAELIKNSPELKYSAYIPDSAAAIAWRVDKPELPFYKLQVRRALAMAVDNQAILDTLFGGQGELLSWPISPIPQYSDIFTPLDEQPENIRELYEYHPDKARQLLADAGYPDGFKTEIVTTSANVDLLAVIQSYWADVGVELVLDVKDSPVVTSIGAKNSHAQMLMSGVSGSNPFRFFYTTAHANNNSMIADPVLDQAKLEVSRDYFDEAKRRQIVREIAPYILEQAFYLQLPIGYSYTFWQPWVKNYAGERQVGYCNYDDHARFIWIDQDLKEEMTGER